MTNLDFQSVGHVLKPTTNHLNERTHLANPNHTEKSFSTYLKDSLQKVNEAQIKSDLLTEKMALGKDVDLHEVMVAAQKANITMQLTVEIRNKVIEAYQEVMRMQV